MFRAATQKSRTERDDAIDPTARRMHSLLQTSPISSSEAATVKLDSQHGFNALVFMATWGADTKIFQLPSQTSLAERKRVAASAIQRVYRGFHLRRKYAEHYHKVNLKYEVEILRARKERRGLFVGFVQHVLYMVLLANVIQSGAGVTSRYEMERVVSGAVAATGFEDIATLEQYNDWVTADFFSSLKADDSGRLFVNTYNEVLGSVRLEVMRVDPSACPWTTRDWQSKYRLARGHSHECYGWLDHSSMANESFGPDWEGERYKSVYRYGEHRYVVDLGRDAVFSFRRLTELTETGFIDDVSTRVVRVRMLFYNSALALLCSLSAEATLSPTGVLRTSFRTASIPVQEYMPHTITRQLILDGVYVVWTSMQILKELVVIASLLCKTGSCYTYFHEPFHLLDAVRFGLFSWAVSIRVRLLMDTSRDIDRSDTAFIDTEDVQVLVGLFDLVGCYLTLLTLLSTIQYFKLTERTNTLKGTLAKAGAAMSTFFLIFLLFFLVYTLVGSYMLGSSLEEFSSFMNSLHTCFAMMNGDDMFQDLMEATEKTTIAVLAVGFYYYSFICVHYFLLLNVIIAIVVDAYMEVQEERSSVVATTFRANLGSLGNDLLRIVHRKAATVWLIVSAWFNPAALFRREDTFIEWDDDAWLHVLQQVVDARRAKGIPSRGTSTLAALTREVKKLPRDNRTIAERIANARLFSSSDAQAKAEDGDLYKDATFRQVVAHFFNRPYWQQPANLAEPFDGTAQPVRETWSDCTLEKVAMKVDLLDRRSFSTATTIHLLQHDVDEVLAHEERGVKRGK